MTDLPGNATPPAPASGSELLARLAQRGAGPSRYADAHEIARGGMGAILEVRDLDLRRKLAMKVLRERGALDRAQLQRFLEEAQVTAQLDHPGVVPVHEIGIDGEGRVFFTMALVRGRDLEHVFGLVRGSAEGWTRPRALEVLLKVCDTMAFAHAQGVIHRDLKPANVMAGSFGEVYVMDWGLAKLAGPAAAPEPGAREQLSSERRDAARAEGESSLVTLDGAIVGTPAYMSPEQARGEELDSRTDVYALGAMLYALCAGRSPYGSPNVALNAQQILSAILKGPPPRLETVARDVAPELAAICEKAMARERDARYQDMRALAEDLRHYLEGRVVRAYRTGAWVEFKKWVLRNKGMAGALAGVLLALLAGGVAYSIKESQRADVAERALHLADGKIVLGLEQLEQQLWPAVPDLAPKLAGWVQDAREVLSRREEDRRTLAKLKSANGSWPTDEAQTLEDLLAELTQLEVLVEPVERRAELAASLRERTLDGPAARARWANATAAIAANPRYHGLELAPQLGLLPLEEDPGSGLWEFWHVQSGAEPQRGGDGRWRMEPETGVVLVLLPGGATSMGSTPLKLSGGNNPPQSAEEYRRRLLATPEFGQPWVDQLRDDDETFYPNVQLDPFLISKYEATQAQWVRAMGANPSEHSDQATGGGPVFPVTNIDWHAAGVFALRLSLALPTEAQWEYAARAGTTSTFPGGSFEEALQGRVNLKDHAFAELRRKQGHEPTPEESIDESFDDGWALSAPIGSFPPSAFGLNEILGNVWEWCRDAFDVAQPPRPGDGLRGEERPELLNGAVRGGSWFSEVWTQRPANRTDFSRAGKEGDVGVRFVRGLQR